MRHLNPDQLRTLLTVIETRSFSAAARRLHLSQPAVSVQVSELEKRCGVALIERVGKQAHPTQPGAELADYARRILGECEEAEGAMRRYREGWLGRVRIGATDATMTYILPAVLKQLNREHPGIEIVVLTLSSRESVEALRQNTVDVAIVTMPVDDGQLAVTPLFTEQLVAILPASLDGIPDHVTPDFVKRHPYVMDTKTQVPALVMQWLNCRPSDLRIPVHLGTSEAMQSAVAADLGLTIVPETTVAHHIGGITARPLSPRLERVLAMAMHAKKPRSRALDIVVAAIGQLSRRDAPGC